jgi:ABC-type taurine transport system ATPase subunit
MAKVFALPGPSAPRRRGRPIEVVIGEREIRELKMLVEYDGLEATARAIGISSTTLLRVLAGMLPRCQAKVQRAVRAFFAPGGEP